MKCINTKYLRTKYLRAGIIFIITGFNIVGCGGGSGSDNPDSNTANFRFFPQGFFVAGYREEFNLAAVRRNALTNVQIDTFTNNQVIITQAENIFNSTNVIPSLDIGKIGFSNGTSIPVSGTGYYTIDNNDRRYLGNILILLSIVTTTTAVSTKVIPETVNIGDFGDVGIYLDNFATRYIISWDVADAGNSQARLTWTTRLENTTDNSIISEREDIFIIDTDGNRIAKEVYFETFNLSDNFIDEWTGVKVP